MNGVPNPSEVIAMAETADGRVVVLTASAWDHIASDHPEMTDHRDAILMTASNPEIATDDPRPGRRRHFRSGIGPSRWLRVVIDFNRQPARIVTAHAHRKEPI